MVKYKHTYTCVITFAKALRKVHVEAEGRTDAKEKTHDSCLRYSRKAGGWVAGQQQKIKEGKCRLGLDLQ